MIVSGEAYFSRIEFTYLMTKSADPTDLDLHWIERYGLSGFSRIRVKYSTKHITKTRLFKYIENFT